MNYKLVMPDLRYKSQYLDFISECSADIRECGMDFFMPISSAKSLASDIETLTQQSTGDNLTDGWVPADTYWLFSKPEKKISGAVNIRHRLSEYLKFRGGHISYYIADSDRRKGYGTLILSLALQECRRMNIESVMISCARHNIGSKNIIKNNGGVFDSEDIEGDEVFERYWIELK